MVVCCVCCVCCGCGVVCCVFVCVCVVWCMWCVWCVSVLCVWCGVVWLGANEMGPKWRDCLQSTCLQVLLYPSPKPGTKASEEKLRICCDAGSCCVRGLLTDGEQWVLRSALPGVGWKLRLGSVGVDAVFICAYEVVKNVRNLGVRVEPAVCVNPGWWASALPCGGGGGRSVTQYF